ncbi:MAG: sigma-70 family RNA polymerase sigma factor [Caldilineae bacterium]|nr:sigma-70 family RNA polymerase sigma factor [Caldilineae bacterium]
MRAHGLSLERNALLLSPVAPSQRSAEGPAQRAAAEPARAEPGLPDEQAALVQRAAGGEPLAFGELYRRHVERVHRFIAFRVGDEAAARDLTQDAFLRALRGIAALERPERFEAWLLAIAHRTVQNHYRSLGRRPDEAELEAADAARSAGRLEQGGGVADPQSRLEATLRQEALRRALSELSQAQQEVLGLRFVAGLSFAETAEITGRSLHAVRKLQYRGLALLRGHLVGAGEAAG